MQRKSWLGGLGLVAIALTVSAAGIVATAGENVWVSERPEMVFFGEGDAQAFDLSELADGETRVFGDGDKQVTVSRIGDEASIERLAVGGERPISVTCRLSTDTCKVLTVDEEPERVMIVIEKTSRCENGVGDCDMAITDLDVATADHMSRVLVHTTVDCDDDENCNEFEHVTSAGPHVMRIGSHAGPGELIVIEGTSGPNVFFSDDSQALLRCPEGDASLHVAMEEADDVFLCPKHSVPLERQKQPARGHFKIRMPVHEESDHE